MPATDFCRILRFVDNVLSGLLTFARVKPPATMPLIIKTRRGLGPLAVDGGRSGEKLDWICKAGTRWEWFRNHIQSHRKRAFFALERSCYRKLLLMDMVRTCVVKRMNVAQVDVIIVSES